MGVSIAEQLEPLLQGSLPALHAQGPAPAAGPPRTIFPGAFNPLHQGHRRMAAVAARMTCAPAEFELSIVNVDKRPLAVAEVMTRLEQFDERQVVWLTAADTFVKKASIFPAATFVVGVDTIERVADVGYYASPAERDHALVHLRQQGCRFLVFGRLRAGQFCRLEDCRLPTPLVEICEAVPEAAFRQDVSSTELRKRRKA